MDRKPEIDRDKVNKDMIKNPIEVIIKDKTFLFRLKREDFQICNGDI